MVCIYDDDGMLYAKRDYFGGVRTVEPADLETLRRVTLLP